LTVLDPLTRTFAKLGLAPALVCEVPTLALDWKVTVSAVTPAGATKPVACVPVQFTVWPLVGVAGWQ
ncbi:hypothetical protein, partial [Stenotrophomonas maltophilia]|uniref:hypothetical protein n=1 Tax=Stenotrophomonas maltophilia TaxID=40324 RepID=UPI0013DBA347